ncbi:MAG TPA: trimethylamine methyltransferase family protein [Anaerolineae bacterium]|nr:trimethylamine methyltransferase family protein [Anaerolineae bacterium]
MRTLLQVLSADERTQVHERTLRILAKIGARVDTAKGRHFLKEAGAEVDEDSHIVRFPRSLVEESLRLAPKEFVLGARRPGWDLQMNGSDCTMLIDGEAMFVLDRKTKERRPATYSDWLETTRLIDALDEIGLYWSMVELPERDDATSMADLIKYWRRLFSNFSKHIQDGISTPEQAPWLLEVLQVIFGDKQTIRQQHPLSFLLCPQSPLIIDGPYTDAYLALLGWDIPVGIMPMPLMGATAPASLISLTTLGNCEVLAMLCLLQAASPGTPIIYAPALAIINPRSGLYSGGAIESALTGAAATEMARYYGLPVEASGLGTDQHVPSIQAGYERGMGGFLPALSWPDILVGPGLLGGSMILSQEQLFIDVEIFRMYKQARRGIVTDEEKWLDDVIEQVGPGGNFLGQRSTRAGMRSGEWYISKLGVHDAFESWDAAGRPGLLEEINEQIDRILATHRPLPLDEDVEQELLRIQKKAQAA